MDSATTVALLIIAGLLAAACFFLPTYIAFHKNHHYRWVIFGINVVAGASGLGWLVAFIWAVYPTEKTLADPMLGNPSGLGRRNIGDTLREVREGHGGNAQTHQTRPASSTSLDTIERLAALLEKKLINQDEFDRKKSELLDKL